MSYLREDNCRKGVPLRNLWTAEEARTVKSFVNNLRVQMWNLPYTEVDPDNAVIYLPAVVGGEGGKWTGIFYLLNEEYDVLDDYDAAVFELTGDAPEDPVLTGWNSDGEWYGWVRGEFLVVRIDGEVYDGTEYDGEYEDLNYRFANEDDADWDEEIEKIFRIAKIIEATGERDEGYSLTKNVQGDVHIFGAVTGGWTGVIWFGNTRTVVSSPLVGWDSGGNYIGNIDGEYLIVNLRDGSYEFKDSATKGDGTLPTDIDDAEEQIFRVANYVEAVTGENARDEGYRLSTATQGDIHARIT
jgi:hypothetical protein